MIRPAKVAEIPHIMAIAKACGAALRAGGIFQWIDSYPREEAFLADLERGELWVLDPGSGPVGMITSSRIKDAEYETVDWLGEDGDHRYIHRLGVHPEGQGQGAARKLMDFAEQRARQEGADSVRLDTFSRNPRNQRFYEQRGYVRLGAVYFPKQSAYPFYCYELPLRPGL